MESEGGVGGQRKRFSEVGNKEESFEEQGAMLTGRVGDGGG